MKKRTKIIGVCFFILALIGTLLLFNGKTQFFQKDFDSTELEAKIRNRDYIDELRNTYTTNVFNNRTGDDLAFKSYKPTTKEILIEDGENNVILKMRLTSPYVVSGLIASNDTKVADFYLEDWEDGKVELIDTISFHDVHEDYKSINKDFRFKWKNETEVCFEFEIKNATSGDKWCETRIVWHEFDNLKELPHKNIEISLWANTEVLEKIEWIPTIEGFEILQWAAWDIQDAFYDGSNNCTTLYEGDATGVYIGDSGTKLYVVGWNNDTVRQYTLSTPYDLTTCTDSNKYAPVNDKVANLGGLTFRPNGKSFYIAETGRLHQYNCTTDWDASTCTFEATSQDFGVSVIQAGIDWKPDGTFLYTAASTDDELSQLRCSTPWNITTCTQVDSSIDTAVAGEITPYGLRFKTDGTELYFVGRGKDKVYQFDCSIAWNLSSCIDNAINISIGSVDDNPKGIWFRDDGSSFFISGNEHDKIYRWVIDETNPDVNITYPLDTVDYQRVNTNLTINYSASDSYLKSCWGSFDGGTNNISLTCADLNITRNITSINNNTFSFWANDTVGNVANITRTWDYKIFQFDSVFRSSTAEGATEIFKVNFTQGAGLQTSTVDFVYNSTSYASTFTVSSDNVSVIHSLVIPDQNLPLTIPFYWSITLSDGSEVNTTPSNQTVDVLKIGNCSNYSTVIYNFTAYDEATKTKLSNTTIEVQIEIYDAAKISRILNFSQLYEDVNPAEVCINSSLLTTVNYSVDAVVKYTSNDSGNAYAKEHYHILGQLLTNSTVPRQIALYNLLDADSTDFQLTFKDSDLAFAPNILVYLYRQYVQDNDFKIVEIPLTDSNGQTVLHMVRNDVVYNIVMVNSAGTIIATFNKIIAFCQDYTIGSCSINLNAAAGVEAIYDYTDDLGISYTAPTYSNLTNLVSFTFVSDDLSPKTVSTRIIKDTNFGNRTVCENSLTSATGTVTCNVSSILSTDRFLFIDIFVNGDLKVQSSIDLEQESSGFGVVDGAFYAFLIILFLITMFMQDKQALVLSLVVGWGVVLALGLLSGALIGALSGGIWLIVCVAIFIWKLKKEEVG